MPSQRLRRQQNTTAFQNHHEMKPDPGVGKWLVKPVLGGHEKPRKMCLCPKWQRRCRKGHRCFSRGDGADGFGAACRGSQTKDQTQQNGITDFLTWKCRKQRPESQRERMFTFAAFRSSQHECGNGQIRHLPLKPGAEPAKAASHRPFPARHPGPSKRGAGGGTGPCLCEIGRAHV